MIGCHYHDAGWVAGCDVFATDENAVLAGKAGAIDAVVAAMRAHVGNAGVLEQACGAMNYFCFNGALGVGWLCVECSS